MSALHVVVMGVSGSGKPTVGKLLAEEVGANFIDGDALHREASVAKMAAGRARARSRPAAQGPRSVAETVYLGQSPGSH